MPRALFIFCVVLIGGGVLDAADWPQLRGAERDAVWRETGIMEKFPEQGLSIRWRRPVGPGWASPAIAEGRVYVFDAVLAKPKAEERLLCLDEKTGHVLWEHRTQVAYPDWAFTPGNGPIPTPAVHEGKVYTLGMMADLFCLDAATGAERWHRNLMNDYKVTGFTAGASPFVDGRQLIIAIGGKPSAGILSLDKNTGEEIWRALDEASANSSPLIVTAGGQRQLICWTQQSVSSLDPSTGKLWWRERLLTSSDSAVAAPVLEGRHLLVGGLMFELAPDKPAAHILWPDSHVLSKRVLSNTSTALIEQGHVYSARTHGEFVCLDARTGQELWSTDAVTEKRGETGASIHLTPQGDSVLLFTDEGNLIRARLSPEGYHELSRTQLMTPTYSYGGHKVTWSPPSFANGAVFVRNEKEVLCAEMK